MLRPNKFVGAVVVTLVLGVTAQADEITSGKVKSTDLTRNEVVLKGVVKDTIYELAKDAPLWLDGVRCKLGDIKSDDRAIVTYEKKGEHLIASRARFLRHAQETTGTVRMASSDRRELVIKGTIKDTTYDLTKDAKIWVDSKEGKLADLREGDEVLITYEDRKDRPLANDVVVLKRK